MTGRYSAAVADTRPGRGMPGGSTRRGLDGVDA